MTTSLNRHTALINFVLKTTLITITVTIESRFKPSIVWDGKVVFVENILQYLNAFKE